MTSERIRIIGIGNPLMGDDGIGIEAIRWLENEDFPDSVELIDGGCAGLKLLPLLFDCDQLLIIDAADFGARPGQLKTLTDKDLGQITLPPKNSSAHEMGLADILHAAKTFAPLPPLTLILIQINSCQPSLEISAQISEIWVEIMSTIKEHVLILSSASR